MVVEEDKNQPNKVRDDKNDKEVTKSPSSQPEARDSSEDVWKASVETPNQAEEDDDEEFDLADLFGKWRNPSERFDEARHGTNTPTTPTSLYTLPQLQLEHMDTISGSTTANNSVRPVTKYCGLSNPSNTDQVDAWNASLQLLYCTDLLRQYFTKFVAYNVGFMHNSIGFTLEEMAQLASTGGRKVMSTSSLASQTSLSSNPGESGVADVIGAAPPLDHRFPFLLSLLKDAHKEANRPTSRPPGEPYQAKCATDAYSYHTTYQECSFLGHNLLSQIESIVACAVCKHQTSSWSMVWVWQFDLPFGESVISLAELIQQFGSEELCPDYFCTCCVKCQNHTFRQSLVNAAPLLFIHIKRFYGDEKIRRSVLVPEELEITLKWYTLHGAILHRGSTGFGHYTTLVREANNTWVHLDDEKIQRDIRNDKAREMLAKYAYLLLYTYVKQTSIVIPPNINTKRYRRATPSQTAAMVTSEHLKLALISANDSKQPQAFQPTNNAKVKVAAEPVKSSEYGYCGLVNQGMTCYVNASLQAIYSCSRIREYLIEHPTSGPFHAALSKLFLQMETESARIESLLISSVSLKPEFFLTKFRDARSSFGPNQMHDAQEFLTILFDILHQEVNVAKKGDKQAKEEEHKTAQEAWNYHVRHIDDSYLSRLLMGQLESMLTCVTCGRVSQSWVCVWQLQAQLESQDETLSIVCKTSAEKIADQEKTITLKDCLKEYFSEETLKDDSAPFCAKCQSRQPATKRQSICRVPHYLIVHLKRFAYDGTKIHSRVCINERLDLCGQSFLLSIVVLHRGIESRGHYFALYRERDNQWVCLDDDTITKQMTNKQALELVDALAYLCIYRAIQRDDKQAPEVEGQHHAQSNAPSTLDDKSNQTGLQQQAVSTTTKMT